jgi:hypothetical protein
VSTVALTNPWDQREALPVDFLVYFKAPEAARSTARLTLCLETTGFLGFCLPTIIKMRNSYNVLFKLIQNPLHRSVAYGLLYRPNEEMIHFTDKFKTGFRVDGTL